MKNQFIIIGNTVQQALKEGFDRLRSPTIVDTNPKVVPSARKDNSTDYDADDVVVGKNDKEFIFVSMEDEAATKGAGYHVDGSATSSFNAANGDQHVDSLQTAYYPNEVCPYNLSCKLNFKEFLSNFCYHIFLNLIWLAHLGPWHEKH